MWDMVMQVLSVIGSALFMIFFFGMCIFIHELGHFLVARWCGLHVVAFSIGFKKVWAKKINGVEYRIGCIPVGGYVDLPQIDASGDKIVDENGEPLPRVAPWKRLVTAFAGPFFNILFALFLGCFVWYFGLPQSTPKLSEMEVATVQADKPEYNAGLRPGDVIFQFNGKPFERTWNEFSRDIMLNVGDVKLTVRKPDGSVAEVTYQPAVNRQVAPNAKVPVPFFTVDLPVVVAPQKDSPAEKAGLREGDLILAIDGKPVWCQDFWYEVRFCGGKPLRLTCKRGGDISEITVVPEKAGDFLTGLVFSPNGEMMIDAHLADLPAKNKLKPGDVIVAFNGRKAAGRQELEAAIQEQKDQPFTLTVRRGKKTISVTTHAVPRYQVGVMFRYQSFSHPSPFRQFSNVLDLTWRSLKSVSAGVSRKIGVRNAGYTTLGPQHFSGPVGIGQTLYLSVFRGSLIIGLNLVVLISYSLGLFNLLPIPVLDGGHILLAVLEMIFRRPVSPKVLQPIMIFFIAVLIGFMIFVTFFDIKRMIPTEPEKQGTIVTKFNLQRIAAQERTRHESETKNQPED